MTSNLTSWSFPPALNTSFRDAFNAESHWSENSTEIHGVYNITLAAVKNLTLQERVDSRFANGGWGGEDAVVSVGDTVSVTFAQQDYRNMGLNCILCTRGRGLGPIEQACNNYTDTADVQPFVRQMGPSARLNVDAFPSLDQYAVIPNETVALCIFTIFESSNSHVFCDYSVPFPVRQQQGTQRKVFNATFPTGVAEPRPSQTDPYSIPAQSNQGSKSGNNTGLVVGVVVGVLFVLSCIMGLAIFLWTRRRAPKKVGGSSSNPALGQSVGSPNHGTRGVALQHLQSSARRPEASFEIPPPYHEVVRGKTTVP